MRHNARLTIIQDSDTFNIYFASFATPNEIKVISRKALTGTRRHLDAEAFYIKLIQLARSPLNIMPLARDYLWEYDFNLSSLPPTLTITNASNGLSKTTALFRWLGPERSKIHTSSHNLPLQDKVKKRGRRSELSKAVGYSPAPLRIDPVLGPVFASDDK